MREKLCDPATWFTIAGILVVCWLIPTAIEFIWNLIFE